jgi:hypothetical protein
METFRLIKLTSIDRITNKKMVVETLRGGISSYQERPSILSESSSNVLDKELDDLHLLKPLQNDGRHVRMTSSLSNDDEEIPIIDRILKDEEYLAMEKSNFQSVLQIPGKAAARASSPGASSYNHSHTHTALPHYGLALADQAGLVYSNIKTGITAGISLLTGAVENIELGAMRAGFNLAQYVRGRHDRLFPLVSPHTTKKIVIRKQFGNILQLPGRREDISPTVENGISKVGDYLECGSPIIENPDGLELNEEQIEKIKKETTGKHTIIRL